ncbi:MAG: aspartate carbamoyltransferase [bacterium]|nr:aspartate carbamoyltransferase [bacterium]
MRAPNFFPREVTRTQDFEPPLLQKLFDRARTMRHRREKLLEGQIMCSLFYEPSTRTRHRFESAMYRLGGNVIGTENAREFSSVAKGESLEHTIRVESKYSDLIVLRHTENDAAERAARVTEKPIINAGCGTGQHPTQAFLDLFTIENCLGSIDGISIAFFGDVKHSRVVRSNAYLLGKYQNVKQHFISPKELQLEDDIKEHFREHKIPYWEHENIYDIIGEIDVLYVTRLQLERLAPEIRKKYQNGSGYRVDRKLAEAMPKGSVRMHPLPIKDEVDPEVDDMKGTVYLKEQIENGLLISMALLAMMLGR